MAHTPGPWTANYGTVGSSRGIIANCPTPQHNGVFDLMDNARLIAAAPALLEALKNTREHLKMMVSEGMLEYYNFDEIDQAIAAAEGET